MDLKSGFSNMDVLFTSLSIYVLLVLSTSFCVSVCLAVCLSMGALRGMPAMLFFNVNLPVPFNII